MRYLDSADSKISYKPDTAMRYLDSIPFPLEKSIKGNLGWYYQLKALVYESKGEQAELFKNFLLSLQYAEKEENYKIAGFASCELFYNLYITDKDSVAYEYLDKAKYYYEKANDKFGLLDVMQAPATVEFHDGNHNKSNELILSKLDYYKSIKEDGYYYMFSVFMLASNYIHLDDSVNTRKYFRIFKSLENDSTISSSLYKRHKVSLLICSTEPFLKTKKMDSAAYYFNEAKALRQYMNDADVKNYFNNLITYYDKLGNKEARESYTDSLDNYQNELFNSAMSVNFNVSSSLAQTKEELIEASHKKELNRFWIVILILLLIVLIAFVLLSYKQIRNKILELTKRKKDYNYLQENHEKLKAKTKGLESFIEQIKNNIKEVSKIDDKDVQRQQIKELYTSIRQNSSTLLIEGESHFQLINKLNIDFFNNLSQKHPELNESEIIICYYLFTGFKNKEIAAFLNTSIRSVESKRYRISKKLQTKKNGNSLVQYLVETFKDFS
ncbi:helix-turn-helix transcriptional regulator [Winogradskyella pulchriflava]|uniref:Helix-turn-helix transcriptional regulator n=1 Tax=Winogradskyella pulchriflava TaxID=1110688 RepID=A0ABV6QB25_9FLAO